MINLALSKAVLGALGALGVAQDDLLAQVNEAEAKDPEFRDGLETVKSWLVEQFTAHVGIDAAKALAASVAAQILGKKPGYDPDHAMDA